MDQHTLKKIIWRLAIVFPLVVSIGGGIITRILHPTISTPMAAQSISAVGAILVWSAIPFIILAIFTSSRLKKNSFAEISYGVIGASIAVLACAIFIWTVHFQRYGTGA